MEADSRVLAVVAHNLGDAAIASSFLRRMVAAAPGVQWDVWCRPEVAILFQGIPGCVEVTTNRFPVGTNKQLSAGALLALLRSIVRYRHKAFDLSFDLIGDFRDVGLARLAGTRQHISPVWPESHPFRRIVRGSPRTWVHRPVEIPLQQVTVYGACERICSEVLRAIGASTELSPLTLMENMPASSRGALRVGMHPFASQECKLWPSEYWRALCAKLQSEGHEVFAFSAPAEIDRLRTVFAGSLSEDRLIAESLPEFMAQVAQLDVLVGLDSFAVHVAHLLGVPSVMLNGANHPRLWTPPGCTSLTEPVDCGNQPCLNKPTCESSVDRHACMRAISPHRVAAAIGSCAVRQKYDRVRPGAGNECTRLP